MTFGNPVEAAEAIRMVHWAIDHGINFFDTADMYEGYDRKVGSPGGVAETILGDALQRRRERVVITTKVGSDVGGKGLGRPHVLRQIDASLRRLRTDYVDLYLMHRPDPDVPLAESVAAMAELVSIGKIRHWGFSNFADDTVLEMISVCDAHAWPRPVVSQPPYSWLKRDIEAHHLPLCRGLGIAVTPYQPLQGGLLTGKYRRGQDPPGDSRASGSPGWVVLNDSLLAELERFEAEAASVNLPPAQYAIAWLLRKPDITSIIMGVTSTSQLADVMCDSTCASAWSGLPNCS